MFDLRLAHMSRHEIPAPAFARHAFARAITAFGEAVRNGTLDVVEAVPQQALGLGVYASWGRDPLAVALKSAPVAGGGWNLSWTSQEAPDWFTLNFVLGSAALNPGDVFGFMLLTHSPRPIVIDAFIRLPGANNAPEDIHFSPPLRLMPGQRAAFLTHTFVSDEVAQGATRFATLVLRLPIEATELRILDISAFFLEAVVGERTGHDIIAMPVPGPHGNA